MESLAMKNIAFLLCLSVFALLAQPVSAQDAAPAAAAPAVSPADQKIIDTSAQSVEDTVTKLGYTKLVWSQVQNAGQIVRLQYMPEDIDDPAQWSRMLEVTIYGLAGEPKADLEAEKKLIRLLETQFNRATNNQLTFDENYMMNNSKDIGMFVQYTLNGGKPEQLTMAGAFLRLTDKSAFYVQLDARNRPLKKKEATMIHKLVNPQADVTPKIDTK